ncbi:Putative sensor [Lentzea albidocapillata subsp. violacea]|uniref:Putative sensor n=1 Tax=Lentzea albidocapillata subsp. violacea TaxID=128104 RepID=A0A1G9JLB8_9PSEU|nr:sensor domain-containing protein [Lentzea albidocapillata]SDL37894.1 Putative sensor [Lentzea albidocapillata subsp. violacea]
MSGFGGGVPRNPLRLVFSSTPWLATGYLLSYVVVGTALFVVAFSVLATTYALSLLTFGIPLLAGAALVVRGCAEVERKRAELFGDNVAAGYRTVEESGLFAQIKVRWTDPATLRDCGYLVLMYVPLVLLDFVAALVWLSCLFGVTVPLWYWASPRTWHDGEFDHGIKLGYFPSGADAPQGIGIFIGDLPTALLVAAAFAVLSLGAAYVVVFAARLHAGVTRSLLGPRIDPLERARRVLTEPGPLEPWPAPKSFSNEKGR